MVCIGGRVAEKVAMSHELLPGVGWGSILSDLILGYRVHIQTCQLDPPEESIEWVCKARVGAVFPNADFYAECLPSEDILGQGCSLGLWQVGVCTSFLHPMEASRAIRDSMVEGQGLATRRVPIKWPWGSPETPLGMKIPAKLVLLIA